KAGNPAFTDLEQEVQAALNLAPRLEYAQQLLAEIRKRRSTGAAPAVNDQGFQGVRHLDRTAEGWSVSETANFRFFHQSDDLAERAARVAELTRATMQLKWFGGGAEAWNPKCDIYLHPSADAYGRATGQYNSPGHSSLRMENGRLVTRRIDLHCDDPNMLR